MNILDELAASLAEIRAGLARIEEQLATPKPDWESMPTAQSTRRKSRKALMRAIEDGRVLCKREVARGGHQMYLMSRSDLDRNFPVRE